MKRWGALLVWPLIAVGFAVRWWLVRATFGTNDMMLWEHFSIALNRDGLCHVYANVPAFNHPPLMAYMASAVWRFSLRHPPFSVAFKSIFVLCDIGTGFILWSYWRDSGRQSWILLAFAWGLDSILISGFHGNTDCICAMFCLLSVFLAERRRAPLQAGLALGLAVNVKLIPLLFVPAFCARLRSREILRFGVGVAVCAIPFLPALIGCGSSFLNKVVEYSPHLEHWGIPYLLILFQPHEAHAKAILDWYQLHGRALLACALIATAALCRWKRSSIGRSVTLATAIFLLLTPGFGVQYTVYLAPVLFTQSLADGWIYTSLSGIFIGSVYWHFLWPDKPYRSMLRGKYPLPAADWGLLTWLFIAAWLGIALTQLLRAQPPIEPLSPAGVD